MGNWVVGVDLGTSSTKMVALDRDGRQITLRLANDAGAPGERRNPGSWLRTLSAGLSELGASVDLAEIAAVSLTGQTNTYILDDREGRGDGRRHGDEERCNDDGGDSDPDLPVIGWSFSEGGANDLPERKRFPPDYFLEHISMPHPLLSSYPLPRLRWIRKNRPRVWARTRRLLQPKDYLYLRLTGEFLSDPYTWRGLANRDDATFHRELLEDFGIPVAWLPELRQPWEAPARIRGERARELGLNAGARIYLGCNDFYASTLGVGALHSPARFDITGTSEHIGQVVEAMPAETDLVTSPYFHDWVHYGATANSGRCAAWLQRLAGESGRSLEDLRPPLSPSAAAAGPLFLPYLRGERAPVFDGAARGVFFGLSDSHELGDLFWAVLEGIAFSTYHIWQGIGSDSDGPFLSAGGATNIVALNQLKANVFQTPFEITKQKEAAALGAALIGAYGEGWYASLDEAAAATVQVEHHVEPESKWADLLLERYAVYRGLYGSLKESFAAFAKMEGHLSE